MDLGEPPAISEYHLELDVDFVGLGWKGIVRFDLPTAADAFALHSDGLEIAAVEAGGHAVPFRVDPVEDSLWLPALPAGPVTVRFSGRVSQPELLGLYRSRQGNGYMLTSQCEPTGARRIFPCLDRPDRKSRIALRVRTARDLHVISNMLEVSTRDVGELREWTFPPTPAMATYLFYLGIGRFDVIEDAGGRVRFRLFAPPGQGPAGRFALEAVPRILAAFEAYYRIPYPMPKLDLVCAAETSFGAMENWGAITFRDTRLLLDGASRTLARRELLETIAHEVAHMWFGNLVTMRSWTDIWLSESLASFLETKISRQIDPTLDSLADFLLGLMGTNAALEGDSLDATHPVRAPVVRPEEIGGIFDEISYGKGSTIVAMLEAYLGEETFRRGVAGYLDRFRYANAETSDLWEALAAVSGEAVAPLMDPWLDRPGLPVVSARLTERGLELSQRRFSYHRRADSPPWPIPMVIDVDGRRERIRFDTATRVVPAPLTATVHLNPGAVGFYRVLYDPVLLDRLLLALPSRPATDRWTFLQDLGAFLFSQEVDWATYARAVRTLGGTSDRLVAEVLAGRLGALSLFFPASGPVQDLARWFFAEQFARLGSSRRPGEPETERILREQISFGRMRVDRGFSRELSEQFVAWERIDPDLKPAVAAARARTEGASGYRELRRALDQLGTEEEREPLEQALAWTTEPELLRETLDRLISGAVNRGTVPTVLRNAAANPAARPVLWPWLTTHLGRIDEILRGSGLLSQALELTVPILGLGRGEEVREFFRSHPYPEGARGLAKGLERLTILERNAPAFRALGP